MGFRAPSMHRDPANAGIGGALATFAAVQIAAVIAVGPGTVGGHQPTVRPSIDCSATARLGAWVEAAVTPIKTTGTPICGQALLSVDGDMAAQSNVNYCDYPPGAPAKPNAEGTSS